MSQRDESETESNQVAISGRLSIAVFAFVTAFAGGGITAVTLYETGFLTEDATLQAFSGSVAVITMIMVFMTVAVITIAPALRELIDIKRSGDDDLALSPDELEDYEP